MLLISDRLPSCQSPDRTILLKRKDFKRKGSVGDTALTLYKLRYWHTPYKTPTALTPRVMPCFQVSCTQMAWFTSPQEQTQTIVRFASFPSDQGIWPNLQRTGNSDAGKSQGSR
eukprot:2661514-Amphidinium_carterae.1